MTIRISTMRAVVCIGAVGLSAGSCKSSPTPPTPASPVPTTITALAGNTQTATVGTTLANALSILVDDQNGSALSGVGVTFTITAGNGSLSAASGSTDGAGQVSTNWTLGTGAGAQSVEARVTSNANISTTFTATATADVPDSIFAASGDGQTGLVDTPLADSLSARVVDQFGNGVSGVSVTWDVTAGGGVIAAGTSSGGGGDVRGEWTLGPNTGANEVTATSAGLKGSPVTFTATGPTLSLTDASPDPLVEGDAATLTGTGFSLTPANNQVTIGGVQATVSNATATTLTITIPNRDCKAADDVDISVSVSGQSSNVISRRLSPASPLNLAVGEYAILTQPDDLCLQFLPNLIGGDAYVIGVGSPVDANTSTPFVLSAETGAATSPPPPGFLAGLRSADRSGTVLSTEQMEFVQRQQRHDAAEARLRQWERDNLSSRSYRRGAGFEPGAAASNAQVVPNVGDPLTFKVPDVSAGNACTNFITISTVVRAVGTRGVIVTDVDNPTTDSLTQAEIDGFSNGFDSDIYQILADNFGTLGDLDTNQRVIMVLTHEVNRFTGIAGFVFSGDLFPVASCGSSDFGEIFYGYVPDSLGLTGDPTPKSSVVNNMLPLISHEVTHTIQFSRRASAGAPNMDRWEAEGQADLAKELVAHSIFANSPGNDYPKTAMDAPGATGRGWYEQRFTRLAFYYGWLGGTSKAANTPEDCSIFGYDVVPCTTAYYYGSGWAFFRYINDRFGPNYSSGSGTGESALQQDWVGHSQTSTNTIESLTGVEFDSLFAQFSAMLYADGRPIAGLATELQMTSWDMDDIYSQFHESLRLATTTQAFGAFSESRAVRGGSTAYTVVTAPVGLRGALAIKARANDGAPLGTTMRPQVWVLRTN